MTLIGFLIRGMRYLIRCAWRQPSRSLPMRLTAGQPSAKRRGRNSLPLLYMGWRNGSEMQQMSSSSPMVVEESWLSDTVHAQHIIRDGVSDLYIGGVGNQSIVFYSLQDLSQWFIEHGIDADDPVWMYLEHLSNEGAD